MIEQFEEDDTALQLRVEEMQHNFKKLFMNQVEPLKTCIRDYE